MTQPMPDVVLPAMGFRLTEDQGVITPDHSPSMNCPAPWHAGFAFALGYIKAALQMTERA